jgi:Tfp pilus assembly protein PilE
MSIVKTTFRDNAGMTVAEVIIALGIITVGLLALIAAMPLSTSQIAEANLKTTATFLAQQRLEQIRNARWCATCGTDADSCPPAPETRCVDKLGGKGSNGDAAVSVAGFPDRWQDEDYNTIVIAMGASNARYPRFRRQVRIEDCSTVPCSGIAIGTVGINTLRQVTVRVFFFPVAGTGMRGASEETVELVTLVARRP